MMFTLIRGLVFLGMLPVLAGVGQGADRQVVRPLDSGKALVNPEMGWTLHY